MSVWKDAKALYENYLRTEKKISEDLQAARKSGDYSPKKLKEIEQNGRLGLQKSKEVMVNQLAVLRNRYEDELLKAEDFTTLDSTSMSQLGRLGSLLHSGITFTRQEFSRYAEKYGNNRVCSRLLHDEALKSGYDLDNMTDWESKLEKFSWMIDRYSKAADTTDNFQRAFLVDFDAEKIEKELDFPSYSCVERGTDWESVTRSIAQSMVSSGGGVSPRGFIEGFLGADKSAELAEIQKQASDPEKIRFDAMSEAEQAYAMQLNKLGGDYANLSYCMDQVEKITDDLAAAKAARENDQE